jgi:hypothetical protein
MFLIALGVNPVNSQLQSIKEFGGKLLKKKKLDYR